MLYVPGVARGVLFGGYMQYSPANAVCCSQGYYPLEPEMLLFCCCFYLRCFLMVLKDFIMLLFALFYPPRPVGTPPWKVGELRLAVWETAPRPL